MKLTSPMRYPGGKSRLVDKIISRIENKFYGRSRFVEPFVGGGSVFLRFCQKHPLVRFSINDADKGIASFWKVVFSEQNEWKALLEKVKNTVPTVDEHSRQRELVGSDDVVEAGYATLFLNRCSFSGILTSGPIGGYQQQSKYTVGCRYNTTRLCCQIENIRETLKERCDGVSCQDFQPFIKNHDSEQSVLYCDPPYFVKGKTLYPEKMEQSDHVRLMICLSQTRMANWILSYDNADEVREMYKWATIDAIETKYSIQGAERDSWNKKTELVITTQREPSNV